MTKNREEELHQVNLVTWFRSQYPKYSKLLTLGSFGENVGPKRMARLKQMGLTPGYPDLILYLPRMVCSRTHHYYSGLFIEMKSKNGAVRPNQIEMHNILKANHYFVDVAYDWFDAKSIIQNYINMPMEEIA
jgi:hypothetical protein